MRARNSSHATLKRMSFVFLGLITLMWVGIYGVIITGAFSRAFWASALAIETMAK